MLATNSGNAKDQGCSPVSSNCVVWQGPDLECIGVCKGDTVSDVVAKMATELCTLIDMFDLSEFDFTCLAVPVSEQPSDAGGLIQILIDRICALEGLDPVDPTNPTGDCPDSCIVPLADCFFFVSPAGDTITTMPLLDYVNAIGNKICEILDDITALTASVETLQQQMLDTGTDIGDLNQNKASKESLDYQLNAQTNPAAPTKYLPDATRDIENSLISTQNAVGTPTQIYVGLLQAGNISDESRMYGDGIMSGISGWETDPTTTGQSVGNLWLTIRDLREQVEYMKENCCSTGCSDLWLNFRAALVGATTLSVYTDGSTGFTPDWKECTGVTTVTIVDALGNEASFQTSLLAIIGDPGGYNIDLAPTSIDATTTLTVTADTCFRNGDTETQCEKPYVDIVYSSTDCPAVILTVYGASVNYQFPSSPGFTYIINIYYSGGGVPVATQIIASPGITVFQSILGLLSDTAYDFELVLVNAEGESPCPKQPFTTLIDDCPPPINAVAILTTP